MNVRRGSSYSIGDAVTRAPKRPALRGFRKFVAEMNVGNYIALVGLLLAVGSLIWQSVGYFRGPLPQGMAPESVTFRGDGIRRDTDQEVLSVTASNMNYINRGGKDYDAILKSIDVTLEIAANRSYRLAWQYFMKDSTRNEKEQAGPIVVPGGGGVSKEVRFFARFRPCKDSGSCPNDQAYIDFLPWADFLRLAADPKTVSSLKLTFESVYLVPAGYHESHTCLVTFPDAVRSKFALGAQEVPFQSLPCLASTAN
jgi:hypothetical protein